MNLKRAASNYCSGCYKLNYLFYELTLSEILHKPAYRLFFIVWSTVVSFQLNQAFVVETYSIFQKNFLKMDINSI